MNWFPPPPLVFVTRRWISPFRGANYFYHLNEVLYYFGIFSVASDGMGKTCRVIRLTIAWFGLGDRIG